MSVNPASAVLKVPPNELQHGHSGISSWSPLSTLARQYQADQPLLLFVKASRQCSVTVDSIMKQQRGDSKIGTSSTGGGFNNINEDSASITTDTTAASTTNSPDDANNSNGDPFSFLSEESNEPATVTSSASNSSKNKGFGRFLKKVAQTTSAKLERGMHNLAIRADQGRNPDLLAVGVYHGSTLLSLTESRPVLTDQDTTNTGVAFAIPLVVPNNGVVTVKLWVRSGAALLQQTKAAKSYLVGAVSLNLTSIQQSLQQQQRSVTFPRVPLQSTLTVPPLNQELDVVITQDTKFPALCGTGWTLEDPDPRSAYRVPATALHNLPLHQSYALSKTATTTTTSSGELWTATERTVESTVALPLVTAMAQLSARAAQQSLQHAQKVRQQIAAHRHDQQLPTAASASHCQVKVGNLVVPNLDDVIVGQCSTANCPPGTSTGAAGNSGVASVPTCQVLFQRPDSIFEVELLTPQAMTLQEESTHLPPTLETFQPSGSVTFYPKPCQDLLPGLQVSNNSTPSNGYYLGFLRLQIVVPAAFGNVGSVVEQNPFEAPSIAAAVTKSPQVWECIIALDHFLQEPASFQQHVPVMYPVRNLQGQTVAQVSVAISLTMPPDAATQTLPVSSAAGGLVSLMGLTTLVEDILPALDHDSTRTHGNNVDKERRRQQLSTMGYFVSSAYLDQHIQSIRSMDALNWKERAQRYVGSIAQAVNPQQAMSSTLPVRLPSHEDKTTPRPFRPSSSRSELLLAGIPFNVHTATLSLDPVVSASTPQAPAGSCFYNITCGAPADHARGYSNVFPKKDNTVANTGLNSPVGPVTGGLRRLEAKRAEIAAMVANLEMTLTMSIANYFMEARQHNKSRAIHHVPPQTAEVSEMRWKLYEAVQSLHHVTWICAMRRSVVFSQALGIAISSYMASLSDPVKCQSQCPEQWARHGFLVSFEGLLSAAGKELGMIEDASVGIAMLGMVKVVLVSDQGSEGLPEGATPVPSSPYLKWVRVTPSGANPEVEFTVHIGMVHSYYDQRVPTALKNGAPVRLYPLLFEVGVDIRQWGAHAGSNMKSSLQNNLQQQSKSGENPDVPEPTGGLIDDEDDDEGVPDDDVLVQLNSEAFQKLNAYAHAISPTAEKQKTHPLLVTLHQHITSSAGKINHDIVDEAAMLAQQLGGGGVVFCKSGKDRTAMHVTYKQAQFVNSFRQQNESVDLTLADATMMRVHGTRLPICEKNVGQAKFAFNSLQVKFMPEALKPPMHTLAGFLKGGKVFTGGIES